MDKEPKLKKDFDLDEVDTKWEDEVFPEDKMLGKLAVEKEKKEK